MDLHGRVALVTGGSGGVGSAVARTLAGAGASVAVSYLGERDRAEATVRVVQEMGGRGMALQLDQETVAGPERAVDEVVKRLGRLDILINNAAWNIGIPWDDLDALTPDLWDRLLNTNLRGPFLLSRAAARPMREGEWGRIVNVASVSGIAAVGSSIAYACSKAGLNHLTRCLAVALAPAVLVNGVAPGLLPETRMGSWPSEETKEAMRQATLLGHTAHLDDIAQQVLTFCLTESMTGQVVAVDCGQIGH